MAKRFKNYRKDPYDDDWGSKNEGRVREKRKNQSKKKDQRRRRDDKVGFKEFNDK
jgi:hypothetical protein